MWHLSVLRFYRADLCLSCNDTSVRHIFPPAFVIFSVIHITIHSSQALSLYRFVITVVKAYSAKRYFFYFSVLYAFNIPLLFLLFHPLSKDVGQTQNLSASKLASTFCPFAPGIIQILLCRIHAVSAVCCRRNDLAQFLGSDVPCCVDARHAGSSVFAGFDISVRIQFHQSFYKSRIRYVPTAIKTPSTSS